MTSKLTVYAPINIMIGNRHHTLNNIMQNMCRVHINITVKYV